MAQLEGWARELLAPKLPHDRKSEIEKAINHIYVAREFVELDNLKRMDVAEGIRLAAHYYVPEVLERMMSQRPDERNIMLFQSLSSWQTPAGLAMELVRVRWPTIAANLKIIEDDSELITKVINLWRKSKRHVADKQVYAALADLFAKLGLPYAPESFSAKYNKWLNPDRDEFEERTRLWTRLSMILENTGFSDANVAGELETWWAKIRASKRRGSH